MSSDSASNSIASVGNSLAEKKEKIKEKRRVEREQRRVEEENKKRIEEERRRIEEQQRQQRYIEEDIDVDLDDEHELMMESVEESKIKITDINCANTATVINNAIVKLQNSNSAETINVVLSGQTQLGKTDQIIEMYKVAYNFKIPVLLSSDNSTAQNLQTTARINNALAPIPMFRLTSLPKTKNESESI